MEKIKNYIIKNENVEIRGFSKERDDEEGVLHALDMCTRDSAYLAQELNVAFFCDDRILRAILKREDSIESFSTQTLILQAQKQGLISLEQKFEFQRKLIELNYNYVSIDASLIIFELKKENYDIEKIDKLIATLVGKDTNIDSLCVVLAELFLFMMADNSVSNPTKVSTFRGIIKVAEKHHDLYKLMDGLLINLQKHIKAERHDRLRELIDQVFKGVGDK